jgi:hypothetical protein
MKQHELLRYLIAGTLLSLAVVQTRAADLRDPMRPANAPVTTQSHAFASATLQLQAVMRTTGSFVAIVDGKVVRVGDKVNGAVINEISSDSVRYTRGGKQLVASLPTNKITVRANNTLQAGQP